MKKIICIILSTMLCFFVSAVSASSQGRVYVSDISAQAGDSVTISVMTENVEGCCGGSFNVVYDNDLLELISCTKGTGMNGITPYIRTDYAENKVRITWMSSNMIIDGSICDIGFKVKDTADSSAYIQIEELKLSDINGESIVAIPEDGAVIIGKGSLAVTNISLFDFENTKNSILVAGSNKVRTEIRNTLSVEAKPLIIYALYKNNEMASVSIKAAPKNVGKNETVTIENVVNVPMAKGYKLNVIVWDGILNIKPIKNVSFAGE